MAIFLTQTHRFASEGFC